MKFKYILPLLVFSSVNINMGAQEVEKKLDEAKSLYKDGNLEETRFALQQALNELDIIIGKEILELLPAKMNNLDANMANDQVTGASAGFAGLYVDRTYGGNEGQNEASVQLISDSPLLSGINAVLAMPAIMASQNPDQKRIKVDGYKALMQKNANEEGVVSYDVQIPFGNSLITFSCKGFSSENEVISMVNTIPVSKIVAKAK